MRHFLVSLLMFVSVRVAHAEQTPPLFREVEKMAAAYNAWMPGRDSTDITTDLASRHGMDVRTFGKIIAGIYNRQGNGPLEVNRFAHNLLLNCYAKNKPTSLKCMAETALMTKAR